MASIRYLGVLSISISFFSLYADPAGSTGVQAPDDFAIQETTDVDINRKSEESKQLVLNGVKHFMKESVAVACNDFVHNMAWRKGELFVFVFKETGTCLAHGDDYDLIWQNIRDVKGIGGGPLIDDMMLKGKDGGRISFLWNNGYQTAYVQTVIKDGQKYVLGSGFYPENDEFTTKQLVKTAVAYFNQSGKDATFALISNPNGPFVKGDIYMFAYDFNGTVVAHGQNAALVGQNLIDLQDSRGKPLIRELIEVAKTKGKGWVEYYWVKEFKRSYVEKVVDPKTKTEYLIAAGYHPDVTLETVKSFVKRAVSYLKTNGSKQAFTEFSNVVGEFASGALGIFVFDLEGKCLANGENPSFVGQNLLKLRSADGRYFVKDMIERAQQKSPALVSYVTRNANAVAYVEFVETPDGKFVIGAEFFPSSKEVSTQTLVNRAIELVKQPDVDEAFGRLSEARSDFVRGDLSIFVYDAEGTRLVNGTNKSQVWKNLLNATDQQGKMIINDLVTIAINGGGWTTYRTRNAQRKVYVKSVPRKLESGKYKNYIVGSGYFL
jgi:polar amino acid transport system substrate-binding protein